MLLWHFLERRLFIHNVAGFYAFSRVAGSRRQSNTLQKKLFCSVVIYCKYSFKGLNGEFSFGWWLIVILKWFSFCDRRAKELKVLKYFFVNIHKFVLLLIEKCVVQSILVEVNLILAIKLHSELIIRAIL